MRRYPYRRCDIISWLFLDDEAEDDKAVEVASGTPVSIGPFNRVRTSTHRDYLGGKNEPEIIQDAIDAAEADARQAAEDALDRMIVQIHCVGDCEKTVVSMRVPLVPPTAMTPGRSYVWPAFTVTATATAHATVICGEKEQGQ